MIIQFHLDEEQVTDILRRFYIHSPYPDKNITFEDFEKAVMSNHQLTEQFKLIVRSYFMNRIYDIDEYEGCQSFGYSLWTACKTVEDIKNLTHLHYIR